MNRCDCDCHYSPNVMHIAPCCDVYSDCEQDRIIGLRMHKLKECIYAKGYGVCPKCSMADPFSWGTRERSPDGHTTCYSCKRKSKSKKWHRTDNG